MTKQSDTRKVRKLTEKRQAQDRKAKLLERRAKGIIEHWYELVEYFDPAAIRTVDLKEAQGYRTFVHGVIDDMTIVEVPATMPGDTIQRLGVQLGEMGIRALIISDSVRFMKLRPCSLEECELLDEADTEKKGQVFARTGSGAGSQSDGDGSSSSWPRLLPGTPDGDQDDAQDADEPEAAEDP
jgi:hypothetical protein